MTNRLSARRQALEQVIALRVSLDNSFAENGPLRVLPDTHRFGVLTDAQIERLTRALLQAPSGDAATTRPDSGRPVHT